ncbi:MAG: amino acid adenylation domain-containing protein [Candidatus Aminicenantes bacterium]|nr:amino acid adenylation domain-containing protein [Candidatus Aminicenantes bacterium]
MEMKKKSEELTIAAAQLSKERDYWLNKFSGELPKTAFYYDYEKKSGNERRFDIVKFKLSEELFLLLKELHKGSDPKLFMILAAGIVLLNNKYTEQHDIILCAPIYKQDIEGDFVNTVLMLRNHLDDGKTFKELLIQVRNTIIEANRNQNYPAEVLFYELNLPFSKDDSPLSDIAVLLENIHDKRYIQHINSNMIFSFLRVGDEIEGCVEYNSLMYREVTIERIINHFTHMLKQVLSDINAPLSGIDLLSIKEKKQLVFEFNDTEVKYPGYKAIHELFEEQVQRVPGNIVLIFENMHLTYKKLNEMANRLALLLREKGIKPEMIVGIMLRPSMEIIISTIAVLKAGGIYLPIDPGNFPPKRILSLIKDSNTSLLLTKKKIADNSFFSSSTNTHYEILLIDMPSEIFSQPAQPNLKNLNNPTDGAYVIYTSGTTGNPKGVAVIHRGILNYVNWRVRNYNYSEQDVTLQLLSYSFDGYVSNLYSSLVSGGRLILIVKEKLLDYEHIARIIESRNVTNISLVPRMYELLLENSESRHLKNLRFIVLGGERAKDYLLEKSNEKNPGIKFINEYGPTESTVMAVANMAMGKNNTGVIGRPISNVRIYILNKRFTPQPIGVGGEICISGDGLARGYLNNPELTAERFVISSSKRSLKIYDQCPMTNERLYRTGDLARWLPDGNLEFIGRKDQQVKIRGFRIELGEIESRLLKHEYIEEAVVLAREIGEHSDPGDGNGDKHICAFYVSHKKFNTTELRGFLADDLPDYMLPTFFEQIDSIPLTINGKIDRKALPETRLKADVEYVPPGNMIEKTLVDIWANALDVEKNAIGIDTNFFSLGGHSLKATIVVTTIHKKLNVRVPLVEIFRIPTIRELSRHIKNAKKDTFISIVPVEEKEYYELSSAQERLHFVQQMDLGDTAYNTPLVLEIEGDFDMERFEEAFGKLIKRHESLRTSFVMTFGDEVLQKIHEDFEFEVEYYPKERTEPNSGSKLQNPEDRCAGVIGSFIRPFDLSRAPLMRVGVIKIEEEKHILIVDMHHIISDGMSRGILIRDFLSLYESKELPILILRYKDYSEWQNTEKQKESIKKQEEYWLEEFVGQAVVLNMPTDYKRPVVQNFSGSTISFEIGKEETGDLNRIAGEQEATMFMILLASYNILLSKISSQELLVVGTPITGRRHADLEPIIGMFVNMLALQNQPTGEKTFTVFLDEVKEKSLSAFENQDYPFEDLVDRIAVNRDIGRNPIFDVLFALQNLDNPGGEIPGLKFKPYKYKNNISKFDLSLHGSEVGEKLSFTFEYCTKLFKEAAIERFIGYFRRILSAIVEDPGQKIAEIEIISTEEKKQLLFDFNDTKAAYPADKTIQCLFEEQVERTPANTALVFAGEELNYRELNEKSNSLAKILRAKGVKPDSIAAILLERSMEMIISILGILKAGGAYLPIDPQYPGERVEYMLRDSNAGLLLTRPEAKEKIEFTGEIIDPADREIYRESNANLLNVNVPTDLAYIIYTSGTTGKPKGAMIEHRNVVRLLFNDRFLFRFDSSDTWTMFHSPCFDFSVWEMYGALLYGGKLIVISGMEARDPAGYLNILREHEITVLNQTPSAFYNLLDEEIANDNRDLKIKYVIFGGEALKPVKLKKWQEKYPGTKLINMFGITETTVHVTYKEISHDEIESNISNIGKPIPTLSTYITDSNQKLLPIGVPGELCVGGEGVGRGYLNQQELTEEKFIKNPYNNGEYLYKSGDLAKLSEKGEMEYQGRLDQQVKIRGFRIEPEEIESLLLQHDKIKEAVVQLKEPQERSDYPAGNGDKYLWAYVVPAEELTLSTAELREYLANKLPDYMVPSYFVLIEKIPLTPNGKIDRKMLEFYETNLGPGTEYAAPENEMEKVIADTWKSVLKLDKVGINDNFFDIGGHSTSIIRVNNKLKKAFEMDIPVVTLFRYPTVRSLALHLMKSEEGVGIISTEEIDESLKLREDAANILLGDENA